VSMAETSLEAAHRYHGGHHPRTGPAIGLVDVKVCAGEHSLVRLKLVVRRSCDASRLPPS